MDVVCGRTWSAVVGVSTLVIVLLLATRSEGTPAEYLTPGFRPPSVPLVVVDPYLSIWSNADHLYDDSPRHWSGPPVNLSGMISIDGELYRFMANNTELPVKVMQQMNLSVYPTQTVYVFQQDGVQLELTFSTPDLLLPDFVPIYPTTYLTYKVSAIDGKSHSVRLYYDNTAEGVVCNAYEEVVWERFRFHSEMIIAMRIGTKEQNYLGQTGDMIDWGYWYVTVPNDSDVDTAMGNSSVLRTAFKSGSRFPPDDPNQPRPPADNSPVLAVAWDLGEVQPSKPITKYLAIVYDQVYSIRYYGTAMAPYWRMMYNNSVEALISYLVTHYPLIKDLCDETDVPVLQQLSEVGGSNYTTITSLAWRQVFGGMVAVWNNVTEEQWLFMKEISSDGDVSTVDVIYPASPFFLWTAPHTLQLLLKPILEYSINHTNKYGLNIPYNLNWAPHDLGRWPLADLEPSLQEQMPLEESGNMILMVAGIAFSNKNLTWLKPYWTVLHRWANLTVSSLPNPPKERCTDDFEGPFPHNVNLAAKGIVALAAFSHLLRMNGQTNTAEYYEDLNKNFTAYWMDNASPEGIELEYKLSHSWSLKYNLLYQKILQIQVFLPGVFLREETFYETKMNEYGVPLDDRHDYTKTDWLMWVAAMGNEEQFQAITDAVYKFAHDTPDRFPFTDWYNTTTAQRMNFQARPVIGGLFAKMATRGKAINMMKLNRPKPMIHEQFAQSKVVNMMKLNRPKPMIHEQFAQSKVVSILKK